MKSTVVRRPSFVSPRWLLAGVALALAVAPVRAAETAPVEVPILSTDETVKKELLDLDKLLASNPALEEKLRANVDRLTEATFRAENPDIDNLLKVRPNLGRALKSEQHFFITRALARNAKAPMLRKDVAEFDKFLARNADVRKALQKSPRQIMQPDFLIAHPALARFLEAHPALSSVLLQRADKKGDGKGGAGEKKK
jgi:hypothetical protein